MRRVCVFAGSSRGGDARYADAARRLAEALVGRGLGLVYGGGSIGLMGVLADAMLARGAEVIGVIPRALASKEIAHQGLADLRVVASMHERKALMAELADGFVALPGGLGTLEELLEMLTWAQLGLHAKPVGVLDVGGYFAPLAALLDRAVGEGFVRPEYRALLQIAPDAGTLLDGFAAYRAPAGVVQWIKMRET